MKYPQTYKWLKGSVRRRRIICQFDQPLTPRQISKRTGIGLNSCCRLLHCMLMHGVVHCLNGESRRSRLYWITPSGEYCQNQVWKQQDQEPVEYRLPELDWHRYGWVCYSHRETIIKTMTEPMAPSEIKRKAYQRHPKIRMSANNVRDVMRLFLKRGIVRRYNVKKRARPYYELTGPGKKLQKLLLRAEVSI